MTDTRLAVLGSPIGHSKSPLLHRAAYAELGLPWRYESHEVRAGGLAGFIATLGPEWRGLSLTMPVKREALALFDEIDDIVRLVGGANTMLFDSGRRRGFNTDVFGLMRTLDDAGIRQPRHVKLLGSGATAASVIAAVAQLGAESVTVSTRSPGKTGGLVTLADALGLRIEIGGLDVHNTDADGLDAVISALPGGTILEHQFPAEVRANVPLLDVAYDPWPTSLAASWFQAHGSATSGLGMLLYQALVQVRIFVNFDPLTPLPGEDGIVEAMRAAVTERAGASS